MALQVSSQKKMNARKGIKTTDEDYAMAVWIKVRRR